MLYHGSLGPRKEEEPSELVCKKCMSRHMHFENLENSLWMYPVRIYIYIYSVVSVVHVCVCVCVCDVCLFETHVECRKLEGQNMAKLYRHLPIDVQRLRTRMQCSQVGSVQCPKQGSSLLQQAYEH